MFLIFFLVFDSNINVCPNITNMNIQQYKRGFTFSMYNIQIGNVCVKENLSKN